MAWFTRKPELSAETYQTLGPDDVRTYASLQMQWYERAAQVAKAWHWSLKGIEIVAAASIPVFALLPGWDTTLLTAILGATVTVLEGFQQVFRFRDSWLNYRSTAEAMRRELLLHGSRGAPYAEMPDPNRTLAERVAALTAEENTKWISYSQQQRDTDHVPPKP